MFYAPPLHQSLSKLPFAGTTVDHKVNEAGQLGILNKVQRERVVNTCNGAGGGEQALDHKGIGPLPVRFICESGQARGSAYADAANIKIPVSGI